MIRYPCVPCGVEMVCEKNEVLVVHFIDNDQKKGIDACRLGDLWRCPKCGCQVVLGMGEQMLGIDIADQENMLKTYQIIEVKR